MTQSQLDYRARKSREARRRAYEAIKARFPTADEVSLNLAACAAINPNTGRIELPWGEPRRAA